ncbi:MAG TPA: hypothetical protein VKA89_02680 [Solirubrobacterales bacterium]|nr:hypothetical protein [Solirubrobacterales bacterium]
MRRSDTARRRRSERITVGLAAASVAGAGTVISSQFTRMLRRRRRQREGGQGLIENAPVAALDTVGVAVEGYSAAPRSETVLLNLLGGFLGSFAFVRISTWGIRSNWWPFGNVSVGGRHIHHFVPGILLAFAAGTASLLTDDEELENRLAVPMGVGMGLTFDEAALLLDLRDVYWTREGLLSVQVSFGVAAILSSAILTIRMLARGERRQEEAGVIPRGHSSHHAPPPIPVG